MKKDKGSCRSQYGESDKLYKAVQKSMKEIEQGKGERFDDLNELMRYLRTGRKRRKPKRVKFAGTITNAEYVQEYQIRLAFSDETVKIVNLEMFMKTNGNPMVAQFLDVGKFKKFRIWYGDLIWPKHEMAFMAETLYEWGSPEKVLQ